MSKTVTANLQLKLADRTVSKTVSNVVKSVALTGKAVLEREYAVGNTPVTHIGLNEALVTVIVPTRKVNLNFTIGSAVFEIEGATLPVILPRSITSVQMQTASSDSETSVYIFQAS